MKIPSTAEAAVRQLTSLGALVTAKEWERAAIVYALTHGAPKGGPRTGRISSQLTARELAEQGIVGLTRHETVSHYHDCWQTAVDQGAAEAVHLGDTVDALPNLPFPPNPTVGRGMDDDRRQRLMEAGQEAGMRTGSKVVDVVSNVKSVIAGVKADPEFAKALMEDVDAAAALNRAEAETERAQDMTRTINRGRREREAREEEAGPPVLRAGTLRGTAVLLELDGWVDEIVTEYAHDPEGAEAAVMLAKIMEHMAGQLRAWAAGLGQPPSDAEFEREARALLGEPT